MRWRLERSLILAGFLAAAVILPLVGWESYRDTVRVAKAAQARRHSYELGRVLDETRARVVDAETGQRGFLLTGDAAYLEPYHEAIKNLDRVTDELKKLTSENPEQQKRIDALKSLIAGKLAELQRTIDLRQHGLAGATQVVLGGQGKQLMDRIRAVLTEMADQENNLRDVRSQEMADALTGTRRIVLDGNLVSLMLLLLVLATSIRELSHRKGTQEALAKGEKLLSTTLGSIGDAGIATDMHGPRAGMRPAHRRGPQAARHCPCRQSRDSLGRRRTTGSCARCATARACRWWRTCHATGRSLHRATSSRRTSAHRRPAAGR